MLAIKCGVESEDNDLKVDRDWPVLVAKLNSSVEESVVVQALQNEGSIHIFSSQSAIHFVGKVCNLYVDRLTVSSNQKHSSVIGVGRVTDTSAQGWVTKNSNFGLTTLDISNNGSRENGLHWTLERLEHMGFIPKNNVVLWTKTWSASEKILKEFRLSRQWHSWNSSVVEIYSLDQSQQPIPARVVSAIAQKELICFSVKSSDVLDATITALLSHLHKSSARELPQNIFFSVWEKSALARAQQLFLQNRLIPAHEFENHLNARES